MVLDKTITNYNTVTSHIFKMDDLNILWLWTNFEARN